MSDTTAITPGEHTAGADRLDVRARLTGARLLVFGGTGFLGKVWLSMLLHHYPEVDHVWLVVRSRKRRDGSIRQTSEARFWAEVAPSECFDPIRERFPGAAYDAFLRKKITPIPGDVTEAFGGVAEAVRDQIRGGLTALVNTAGVVDFNPPLDYALNVNAFGMQNLVALAKDLGDLPFLHTSTCYVAGDRTGQVDEVNPLKFPFPKADELDSSLWDPAREIAECVDMVENTRHRCNDAFRQTAFLDEARARLKKVGEPARGSALKDEVAKVKRRFEEKQLIDGGTERAQFWGWHNTYTYTKSIGEQILASSGLTFTIVRPAVIESALSYPRSGWNEGINTSAPLIYLAVQGPIQFPAEEETILDVIPVDYVAVGMMLSLAEMIEGTHQAVYQYGTSDVNGIPVLRLIELVGLFKRRHYAQAGGNPLVNWAQGHYECTWLPAEEYYKKGAGARSRQLSRAAKRLRGLGGPLRALTGPVAKRMDGLSKSLDISARISDQFVPFMATHNYRFSCANTAAAYARLDAADQALLPWEPEKIDWYDYMLEVHCPGISRHVFPRIDEKIKKDAAPLRRHDTLLALLDEIAERHDRVPALMRTHEEGFTRVSYRDLRARARACAARLAAAGVRPGDRVVLCALNHPDWAVGYFGILTAGAVAVPMDINLAVDQAGLVARASGAGVGLLDDEARDGPGLGMEGVRALDLHEVTARPTPDLGPVPEFTAAPDTLASILYTSGTTGTPKGVMLTHENFTSMVASLGRIFPLRSSDRVLSVLPLHHTFEFSCGLLLPLSMGARIIYLDELTGDRLAYGLKEGRVTAMVGVPALWQLLERRIRGQVRDRGELVELGVDAALGLNRWLGRQTGLDFGKLFFGSIHSRLGGNIRVLISGGAALPKETFQLFSGLGLHLTEGYGLTEAAPVLTVARPKPGGKPGSVGKPIPGVKIRIANPDDKGIGEVQARGRNVMAGYYQNDRATVDAITDDGWLRTGDLGRMDHRGRLVIMGRAKEVVVTSSGENIYLDDVENSLGSIPYVKEYSLVGIAHPRGGERLGMLVVPDDESELDRPTVRVRAREAVGDAVARLPKVQRPAVIHLVDADLPRTATRKVVRKAVAEILERIASAEVSGLTRGGVAPEVARAIAAVAGVDASKVRPDTRLADELSFDSLMSVELASALQGTSGRPDADALARCETVADVVALAGAPPPIIEVEEDARETFHIPELVAAPMKEALGYAQRSLYGQGLRTRVYGRAFIPQNRPTIVVSNHCSHLDMGLVKFALGDYGRKLVALAAKDYFFEGNKWWVAYFEQLTNLQPLDRKAGFRASLEQAKAVIQRGHTVLLFPEGTRRTDGSVGEFKPLVGKIALETGVDILPVHLEGTFEVLPKGTVLPRGRSVSVRIGAPIRVRDMRRLTDGMRPAPAARAVSALARDAVLRLRDGEVLDASGLQVAAAEPPPKKTIASVFDELTGRFDPGRVEKPVSWYFSLGGKTGPRYTVMVDKESCQVNAGRPQGGAADCVIKTSEEMITRIVREAYVPNPSEFMSGVIKTNQIPLLLEFSRVFNLSEVRS